jgi:hypothetical protein
MALAQQQEPSRGAAAEKTTPKSPVNERSSESSTHAPPAASSQKGAKENDGRNAVEESGEHGKSDRAGTAQDRRRNEAPAQATQDDRREPNRATEEKGRDQKRATDERGSGRTNDRNGETVEHGAASSKGLNANITVENRTRMHDAFVKDRGVPRVNNVDFALSVGTSVPRSLRSIAIPREIIEIEPRWRGYEFFMVGDQAVIVDPRSMEIVAIFTA